MSITTIEMIIVALLAISFVTYRQTRWQAVDRSRLLRMPAILAAAGVFTVWTSIRHLPHGWHPSTTDILVLIGELGAGLVAGVLMGRFAQLRTQNGMVESRLRGSGLAVWLGFIGLRIGFGVLAVVTGATFAAQPGPTLVVLAVIKLVQSLVIGRRVSRHRFAESRRVYAVSEF